jgi:hypothetical protein
MNVGFTREVYINETVNGASQRVSVVLRCPHVHAAITALHHVGIQFSAVVVPFFKLDHMFDLQHPPQQELQCKLSALLFVGDEV